MKLMLSLALIGLMAAPQAWSQAALTPQQELMKLENAWAEAIRKRDIAFLQRIYADEYVSTGPDGTVGDKATEIAAITSGAWQLTSYQLGDLRVALLGTDAAVVTGRNTVRGSSHGKDLSGPYRFTDVFVKRGGRWQVVASQATLELATET